MTVPTTRDRSGAGRSRRPVADLGRREHGAKNLEGLAAPAQRLLPNPPPIRRLVGAHGREEFRTLGALLGARLVEPLATPLGTLLRSASPATASATAPAATARTTTATAWPSRQLTLPGRAPRLPLRESLPFRGPRLPLRGRPLAFPRGPPKRRRFLDISASQAFRSSGVFLKYSSIRSSICFSILHPTLEEVPALVGGELRHLGPELLHEFFVSSRAVPREAGRTACPARSIRDALAYFW